MRYTVQLAIAFLIFKVIFAQQLKVGVLYDSNSKTKYSEGILGGLKWVDDELILNQNSLLLKETDSTFENNVGGTLNAVCEDLVADGTISVTVAGEGLSAIISENVQPVITLGHESSSDNTFNIHPPLTDLNRMFSDFIDFLSWKQFILLYDDSSIYSNLEDFVKNSFERDWHILPIKADTSNLVPTLNSIKNNQIYNVFLFCADDDIATNILAGALSEGVISLSYHWVIGNLDVILPDTLSVLDQNELPRLTMFRMHHHSDFSSPDDSKNSYTLAKKLSFDSVLAVAYATKAYLDDNLSSGDLVIPEINCKGVGSLNDYLKNVNFHGQTGHVTFGSNGQRINYVVDVLSEREIQGKNHMAFWDPENGLNITGDNIEKQIIVTSITSAPFLFLRNEEENSVFYENNNDQFIGLIPDMLKAIFTKLGRKYKIKLVADSKYGARDENNNWTGMIGEIVDRKADVAAAPLTVTAVRREVVDFTGSFMNSGIKILMRKSSSSWISMVNFAILQPFTAELWIVIAILLLCVPIVFSAFECISSKVIKSTISSSCEQTIGNSYWFVVTTLFLQGCNGRSPISFGAKVFSVFWFSFVIMVIFAYGSSLSSHLLESASKSISSVEELANQKMKTIRYGTIFDGATYSFFQNSEITIYSKMWAQMQTSKEDVFVNSVEEGIAKVRNGGYAFIGDSSLLEYSAGQAPCELTLLEDMLNTADYAFAVYKGSPLGDDISKVLLELKNTGELDSIVRRWMEDISECPVVEDNSDGRIEVVSARSFSGAFIYLIFGFLISLFAVLLEWCYFKFIRQTCRKTSCWEIDQTNSNNVLPNQNNQNIELADKSKQTSATNKQLEENKLGTPEQEKLLNISGSSK